MERFPTPKLDTSSPLYFTNSIKQCSVIGNQLNNVENLSSEQIEDLLEKLNHICDHDGVVVFFIENSFHSKLITIFANLEPKLQRLIVKILTHIIRLGDDIKSLLRKNEDFISLLTVSFTHSIQAQNHSLIQESCLNFLVEIYGKDLRYLVSSDQQLTLLQAIIDSFNWDNLNVTYNSICLLNMGFQFGSLVTMFIKNNIKNLIFKLSSVGTNHKMGTIICKFLHNSLNTSESSDIFSIAVDNNLDNLLIKILIEVRCTITAEYYLSTITLLNKMLFFYDTIRQSTDSHITSKEYTRSILKSYQSVMAVSLLEALRTYNVPPILEAGLKTFYLTISVTEVLSTILNKSDQLAWLNLLHEIVTTNFDCMGLIEWSFKVFYEMFTTNNQLIALVGFNSDTNQIPIDSDIIQIFYTQNNLDLTSFAASCDLVSILSSNSEKIQNRFLESNLHAIIHWLTIRLTHNIKGSKLDFQVRISTTNALRSLVIFNTPAKELFFNEEIQYKEAKTFLANLCSKGHSHHNQTFYEVAAVNLLFLASLVEYSPFKYDLILGKDFSLSQISICEICSMNESLIEAMQEILIVLSGSEIDTEFILNVWSFEDWLSLSSRLLNCYAVQKNTLIFLQLNSSKINECLLSRILFQISQFIFRATKLFKDSVVLQVESFVLIQIMLSQYPDFFKYCLEFDLDNFLLNTISSAWNDDIIKIGLQALYHMIESNQNREKIVEKAVKKGNAKMLEFMLNFGTDIGTSTSLLLPAVKLKPDDLSFLITSLLLTNGSRPDNEVIIACITAENFTTTDLLLCGHGISDSEKGSCINWTGLGLEEISISLFQRLYQGIGDNQVNRNFNWLTRRIKHESINLIRQRKTNLLNLSSGTFQFRYPFVQSRTLENDIGGYDYHTKVKDKINSKLSLKDDDDIGRGSSASQDYDDVFSRSLGSTSLMKGRNSSLRFKQMSKRYGLKGSARSEYNVHSVENLSIQSCVKHPSEMNYQYTPITEELDEYFLVFRSGSDYSYHPTDPRYMTNFKKRRDTSSSSIMNFSSRTSLNNFIKQKSSKEDQKEDHTLASTMELNNQSDNASETVNNVTIIGQMDLSRNNLISIDVFMDISTKPKLVRMFSTMTILKLQNNNIKSIPSDMFAHLSGLEQLDISNNFLNEVPWGVFKHCKLVHLNLSRNKIKSFKVSDYIRDDLKSSGKVNTLISLLLSENEILEFSVGALSLFQGLERLDLQIIPLKLSNDDILPLPNLKKLNLRNSAVSSLGKNLLNHSPEIQFVDLSENQLYPIEDMFPIRISIFESLTSVNVSHNNLACPKPYYIPKCILKIPRLQILNISYNNIQEFPPCSMWTSTVLHNLDFSHNIIHTLNLLNAKTNFKNLEILDVSYNRLKKLPPEIGQLSNLNLLNISHNPGLANLPDEIGMLKNKRLNGLVTEGLNLDIKKHLNVNARLGDILKYYHNRLKNSVEYFGLKIMVLGSGGRGKTTLLESLQGQRKEKKRTSITIGINVSKWKFQGKFNERHVNYKFSCWDLAGQEDFYSSHECFISQRALYLVVFDLTKGIEEMKSMSPWLLNLKSQAPQAPIIVIGTHLDKIKDENRENQCRFLQSTVFKLCVPPAFPKISHFIAVDARSPNKTIDKLKNAIIHVLENHRISNEPIIGEKQPASYLKLEEILQETVKKLPPQYPILMEKDIKEIVQKNNLDIDEDELKHALQFLHNCGVIVHFDDVIMRLKNLYFLNPQWLCSMMARIITMKALNPYINNGTMKLSDFIQLFVRQHFTSPLPSNINIETHAMQCLKILEKFDVVFQRSDSELIIPSRLPSSKPAMMQMDDRAHKIRRVFEFCFLPTGFWPRLVTRISVLSRMFDDLFSTPHRELHIWKQGMTMSWENSIYVLLEGRYEDKEIIEVAVTMSELGLKILVQIIDCIEVLIEEWYPGLLDSDLTGNQMMKAYALCRLCNNKIFVLDIMTQSQTSDQIQCTQCLDNIEIRSIAPDIVLGDLPSYLIINSSLLKVEKNPENHIGSGGNGSVYRGRYNGETCAVKYLNPICSANDSPSYRLLRQEIDILRRLRHPSLISLIAVDRERMILELAALGDLSGILKGLQLGRRYLQRVSYQIIDGISFLHEKNILYRDLKMHNVLVFSLELSVAINVKLSDYGISRVMTYFGFVNFQGTSGYQAPEVIQRHLAYDLQSDIFSFGIVLFNIATGGKHPSDNKAYWRPGTHMELISTFGCENWPRMQECIDMCTKNAPDDRPKAKDMIDFITCPSFITIKSVWPLTRQTRIECMVTKISSDGRVEVLLANGNQLKQEVRWIDVLSGKTKGKSFVSNSKQTRVLCTALLDNIALLGTHCGQLWVYNYLDDNFCSTNICFPDSILTITMMKTSEDIRVIVIGLANGTIRYKAGFVTIMDLCNEDFIHIYLYNAPVTNLCLAYDQIFATCGSCIFKLVYSSIDERLLETKIVEINSKVVNKLIKCFYPVTENINNVAVISFYFTIRDQSLVYEYNDQGNQLRPPIDCDFLIRNKLGNMGKFQSTKIMCMTVYGCNRYLAIGTGSGHLIVVDQKINHVSVLCLFRYPIICLQHTKFNGNYGRSPHPAGEKDKENSSFSVLERSISVEDSFVRTQSRNSWLIVVGNGYKSINAEENDGAVLILMSDDLSKISRQIDEHLNCRVNLKRNY